MTITQTCDFKFQQTWARASDKALVSRKARVFAESAGRKVTSSRLRLVRSRPSYLNDKVSEPTHSIQQIYIDLEYVQILYRIDKVPSSAAAASPFAAVGCNAKSAVASFKSRFFKAPSARPAV